LETIGGMRGLAAFRAELAGHLATYAASGGAEPRQVLQARKGTHGCFTRLEGGVVWYPVRDMKFFKYQHMFYPAGVLQAQQQCVKRLLKQMQPQQH
jgi:hypothetical protein